jgi:hypothetical protein
MDQLSDFQDEETLLQYHGRKIGAKVDRTPKCHLEMAGEEYGWFCTALQSFHFLIVECVIGHHVLTRSLAKQSLSLCGKNLVWIQTF